MSAANPTRLEIQTKLRSNILAGLTAFSYTGWDVIEFGNTDRVKADKFITMRYLKSDDVGWQGTHYTGTVTLTRKDSKIEEQHWQLQFILKRTAANTDASILAEDVANDLKMWFNGRGCEELRKVGLACLRIDRNDVFVYNDNSDLYQKRAVFTVKIQLPKELSFTVDALEALKPKIRPE